MRVIKQPILQDIAQARRSVYLFLLSSLDKPNGEQHVWLKSDDFRQSLERLCEEFETNPPPGELFPETFPDYESRYLACFEVGLPEPPVVLLASHYHRTEPAPRIIHEHGLFYRWFGVHLSEYNPEPADHLSNELAFLCWLDELVSQEGIDLESVMRGRSDFLERHLARWAEQAAIQAQEKHLPGVYCSLLTLLAAAAQQDLDLTKAAITTLEEEQG